MKDYYRLHIGGIYNCGTDRTIRLILRLAVLSMQPGRPLRLPFGEPVRQKSSPEGCFQHECCTNRGLTGCWECPDFSCGKGMFDDSHLRLRVFVSCIREDGIAAFSRYIQRNHENGICYHRNGYTGDYDLDTEEAILARLRTGQ